jgi:hypothetical protein
MKTLETTAEVVRELGGYLAVAEITGSKPSAASNWPRFKTFPSNTYLAITSALEAKGLSAPASLWAMKQPANADEESAA